MFSVWQNFVREKRFLAIVFLVIFSLQFSIFSNAFAVTGVPQTMSYQGRLANSAGDLVGGTGSIYSFKFSLWDSATVGAGNRVWPAAAPTAVNATVRQGLFNVNIGDIDSGYPDVLNYDFSLNNKIYLQVEVSSDGVTYETLNPRQPVTSAPFARVAGSVSGSAVSTMGGLVVNGDSTTTNATTTGTGYFGTALGLAGSYINQWSDLAAYLPTVSGWSTSSDATNWATIMAGTTTDALLEGINNQYYTDAKVGTYLDLKDKGYFFSSSSADIWGASKGYLTAFTELDPYYSAASSSLLRYGTTSDALTEGLVNKFYTQAKVWDDIIASTTYKAFTNFWTKTGNNLSYITGNVGIGTSSPIAPLHVNAGTGNSLAAYFDADGASTLVGFRRGGTLRGIIDLSGNDFRLTANTNDMVLYGGTSNFKIIHDGDFTMNGGNVGIGTTTPDANLNIFGTTNTLLRVASSTNQNIFVIDNNGNLSASGNLAVTGAVTGNNLNITNWDNAYNIVNASSTNWDTAYNWGNHALAGYLTSFTESDPYYSAASSSLLRYGTTSDALTEGLVNKFYTQAKVWDDIIASTTLQAFSNYWTKLGNDLAYLTGRVSVGTTSTSSLLNLQASAGLSALNIASSTGASMLTVSSNGNVGIGVASPTTALDVRGKMRSYYAPANDDDLAFSVYNNSTTGGIIAFNPGASGGVSKIFSSYLQTEGDLVLGTYSNRTNQLYLQKTGRVGIGTTSPSAKLTIENTAGGISPLLVVSSSTAGAGTSTSLYVAANGNVGIGTTSPLTKLHLFDASSGGDQLLFERSGATNKFSLGMLGSGSTARFFIGRYGIGEVLDISSTGNLGLGTTSPSAKLTIENTLGGITPLLVVSSSTAGAGTSTALYVAANGNVGIGTESPTTKLHVNSDRTDLSGTAFGSTFYMTANPASDSSASFAAVTGQVLTNGSSNFTNYVRGLNYYAIAGGSGTVAELTANNVYTQQQSSSNITRAVGYFTQPTMYGSGTVTNTHGVLVRSIYKDPGATGSFTNISGITIANASLATNNTNLLIGTETIPTGNFSMYNSSAYNNYFAGNVGIGTTTPLTKLQIGKMEAAAGTLGNMYIQSNTNGRAFHIEENSGGESWQVGVNSLGDLTFRNSDTADQVVFQDDGSVGIGTTSPSAKLDIAGTLGSIVDLFNISSTTAANVVASLFRVSSAGLVSVGTTTGTSMFNVQGTSGLSALNIASSTGASMLTVSSNGNVGVGVASPATIAQISYSDTGTNPTNGLTILNYGATTGNMAGIRFSTYGASNGGLYPKQFIGVNRNSYGIGRGDIVFLNSSTTVATDSVVATDEIMRITYDGKVGIGTNAPASTLNIKGAVGVNPFIVSSSTGDALVTVNSAGQMGIGVAPTSKLNIQGVGNESLFGVLSGRSGWTAQGLTIDSYGSMSMTARTDAANNGAFGVIGAGVGDIFSRLSFGLDTGTPYLGFGPGSTGRDIFLRRESGDLAFTFGTTSVEKFRITSTGNLGIGTTTPDAKLNIFGTTNTLFRVSSSTNQNIFVIDNNGDVSMSGSLAMAGLTGNIITSTNVKQAIQDLDTNLYNQQNSTKEITGFPNRTDTSIAFDSGTRTFTITGTNFKIFSAGKSYTKNTESAGIPNTVGLYYVYYDPTSHNLATSTTAWAFADGTVQVATIYWDGTTGVVGEERHGLTMDNATHEYLHHTVGTRYESGLTGTFNTNNTFSVTAGKIDDEDIENSIGLSTTARIFYHGTASTFTYSAPSTSFFDKTCTGSNLCYDNGTGKAAATGNNYVAYWVFATNDPTTPIYVLMGQRQDTTLANAQANQTYGSLTLGTLPFAEMKLLYRVIVRNNAGNTLSTDDYRSVSNLPSGTYVATLHSSLTGLTNDDHTQYAFLAGRTGGQTFFGGNAAGENLTLFGNSVDYGNIFAQQYGGSFTIGTTSTITLANTLFNIASTTGVNYLTVLKSGLIGLGTGAPTQKLDVIGNIQINGTSTYMINGVNLAYGSTTKNSYFFGGAGNLTMTGADNLGFGPSALLSLTSGFGNLALGTNSLTALTSGFGNLAFGTSSLASLNAGYNNIALGNWAGSNLTTGFNNILIGHGILGTSSTASNYLNIGNLITGDMALGNVGLGSTTALGTTTVYNDFVVGNGAFAYSSSTGLTTIDNMEIGATSFPTDAGVVTWMDMPLTSSTVAGVGASYTANLAGNSILSIAGISDGGGDLTKFGVGIGTTSVPALLAIQHSSTTSTLPLFMVASTSGSSFLSINSTGNLSMGTTSASSLFNLQVASGASALNIASSTGASMFSIANNGDASLSGSLTLDSLNGPLQAVNGLISASSSIGSGYLSSNVMLDGENISLLNNDANYLAYGTTSDTLTEGLVNKFYTQAKVWDDIVASTTFQTFANYWTKIGNDLNYLAGNVAVGTSTFDGTNPEKFLVDAGDTSSVNGLVVRGNINNYFQMNIKNSSNGTNASTDIVATGDTGTENTGFIDMGINSSGYTAGIVGLANDTYLYGSSTGNMLIGNASAGKNLIFFNNGANGYTNERMRIASNGYVGIGNTNPLQALEVGSDTTGLNAEINATIGTELAPTLDSGSWTGTNGWSASGSTLEKVTNATAGTMTPSGAGATPVAGTTYKIVIVTSAKGAAAVTYTYGGITGTTIAVGTTTDYINAATTGKLIITGAISSTATITSVSIKALTDNTGDLYTYGDIKLASRLINPSGTLGLQISPTGAARFDSTLTTASTITGGAGLAVAGTVTGVTSLAHSLAITGTVPTLYVSTDGYVLTAAVSTGITSTLVPLSISPRIRQIGNAWDIDGAANVLSNYWSEVVTYPGNTVNSKLAWYYSQGAMASAAEYQAPEIMNYYNGGLNVFGSTYGGEVLANGALTGGTSWTQANGFSLSANTAVYLHNASGGTLTQASSAFSLPVKANRWYRFTWTSSAVNTTARAYIDPAGISVDRVYLRGTVVTPGTYTTTFKTNSNPGNFIITADSAASGDGFTLDSLSLVEIDSGNIAANGLFTGGGTQGLKIDNLGLVGIGTTTPVAKLDIAGTLGSLADLFNISSTTATNVVSSLFRISSAGLVSVGTTTGTSMLNVQASGQGVSALNIASTTGASMLTVAGNGNVGIGTANPSTNLQIGANGNVLALGDNTANSVYMSFNGARGYLGLDPTTNNMLLQGGGSKGIRFAVDNNTFGSGIAMSINTSGNVGIGTTSPSAKLTIENTLGGNTPLLVVSSSTAGAGTSTALYVTGNGNVGIGTSSPTEKLHIYGGGIKLYDGAGTDYNITVKDDDGGLTIGSTATSKFRLLPFGNDIYFQNTVSSGNIYFTGVNGSDLTGNTIFKGSGLVGLGTTSPSAKLTIENTAGGNAPLFTVASSTAGAGTSTAFHILANGNVGVGTSSPIEKLTVDGNSLVFGSATTTGHFVVGDENINFRVEDLSLLGGVLQLKELAGRMNTGGSAVGFRDNLFVRGVVADPLITMVNADATVSGNITLNTATPSFDFSQQIYTPTGDSTQWDQAYAWGNHANAGYLTNFSTLLGGENTFSATNTFASTSFFGYVGIGTATSSESLTVERGNILAKNVVLGFDTLFQTGYSWFDPLIYQSISTGVYGESGYGMGVTGRGTIAGVYGIGQQIGVLGYGSSAGIMGLTSDPGANAGQFSSGGANSTGIYVYNDGAGGKAGYFEIDKGDNMLGVGINAYSNNSTGLAIDATGSMGIGARISVNDAEYGLKVYNASTTAFSIYSSGGLNYFGGTSTLATTSLAFSSMIGSNSKGYMSVEDYDFGTIPAGTDLGDGPIPSDIINRAPLMKFSSPNLGIDPNGRTGGVSNALIILEDDTLNSAPKLNFIANDFIKGLTFNIATIEYSTTSKNMLFTADHFGFNTGGTTHLLELNGGAYSDGPTWENSSDRTKKENFTPLDPTEILNKINQLPITQWNYISQSATTTHIGPMAQDFYALFGLGGSDTSISTVDPAGVALVGIQALDKKIKAIEENLKTISAGGNLSIGTDGALVVKSIKAETAEFDMATINAGVTVKDADTGGYQCIYVASGVIKTKAGACTKGTGDTIIPPVVAGTSTEALPPAGPATTTEEVVVGPVLPEVPPVVAPTPAPTPEPEVAPTPAPEAAPTPDPAP